MWCKVVSKIGKVQAPMSSVCETLAGEVSLLSEVNIHPVENLNTIRADTLGLFRSILARRSLFQRAAVCACGWQSENRLLRFRTHLIPKHFEKVFGL